MAFNNKEVEIKIKLSKDDFDNQKIRLKKVTKFKRLEQQIDEYYKVEDIDDKSRIPEKWLSLRVRNGKAMLNFKCFHRSPKQENLYSDELETEIQNPDIIAKIFDHLKLKKLVTVKKTRRIYQYKNEFEITLDEVDNLGYFMEVEALRKKDNIPRTLKELENFLNFLDIPSMEKQKRGYPYLLYQKTNNK